MEPDLKSRHHWLQYMLLQNVLDRVDFTTGELAHGKIIYNAIGTSIAYTSLPTHASIVSIVAKSHHLYNSQFLSFLFFPTKNAKNVSAFLIVGPTALPFGRMVACTDIYKLMGHF